MSGIDLDRLQAVMDEKGFDQSSLARAAGCTPGAINQILQGNVQRSRFLPDIADALGVSINWLRGEDVLQSSGQPRPPKHVPRSSPSSNPENGELVPIDKVDLQYGMGATYADGQVRVSQRYFPREWIESITNTPPELLTWSEGRGDSMVPTIYDRDPVLLDRSQRRILEQDEVWAFTVGDLGAIKRLRVRGDRVVILSDNPAVPPDEVHADEVNIVARVIFVGRRI